MLRALNSFSCILSTGKHLLRNFLAHGFLERKVLTVIQNTADPRRNSRIGKVFELAEPCYRRDMERDFRM